MIGKLIRQAEERGSFDDLPGAGKPLPPEAEVVGDPDWWIKSVAQREGIGRYALPVPLALRKEAQDLRAGMVESRSEAHVRELVADYNARAHKAQREPHEGPSVVIPLVEADDAVAAWREQRKKAA
ncbi:MAG: DUF1992 domain-containing protein [Solirubrobacteraceae bacterium]